MIATTPRQATDCVATDLPCPEKMTRGKGVRCSKCKCAKCPVKSTRHYGQRTKQHRKCKHCGHEFNTWVTIEPEG